MPKRALLERRPWLLASLGASMAYYVLKDAEFPGIQLMAMEAASLLLLAGYAWLRHKSEEAYMVSGMMALAGIGVVAVELDLFLGALVLILGNCLGIALFVQRRRKYLAASQKAVATALLVLTPLSVLGFAANDPAKWTICSFAVALGGMAGSAWVSTFPRYRVGTGAVLYVASSLLSVAGAGPLAANPLPGLLAWPLFYIGQFLICTGVIQNVRGGIWR